MKLLYVPLRGLMGELALLPLSFCIAVAGEGTERHCCLCCTRCFRILHTPLRQFGQGAMYRDWAGLLAPFLPLPVPEGVCVVFLDTEEGGCKEDRCWW